MQYASQAEALQWHMEHADDEMGAGRGLRAWDEQVRRLGGRPVAVVYRLSASCCRVPAAYFPRPSRRLLRCRGVQVIFPVAFVEERQDSLNIEGAVRPPDTSSGISLRVFSL